MGYGAQATLGPQELAFLKNQPLSIVAASRGPDNIPALSRSLGCRLSDDLRQITLFFPEADAHELLACIGQSGNLAVVFTLPRTHEAFQLKGPAVVAGKAPETDFDLVDSYRRAFVAHLDEMGYSRTGIETMLACDPHDLVAVTFTPSAVFSQTPGPNAGHAIGAGK